MVVTLRDGSKIEMRSLPRWALNRHNEVKGLVFAAWWAGAAARAEHVCCCVWVCGRPMLGRNTTAAAGWPA
jgi:hypothetical protein